MSHSQGEIAPKQDVSFVLLIWYKSGGCGFRQDLQAECSLVQNELGARLRGINIHPSTEL